MQEIQYENLDHSDFTAARPARIVVSHAMGIDSGFDLHWHRALEITLPVENPILLSCGGRVTEVGEGDVVYVNSGEIHSTEARDKWRQVHAVVVLIPDDLLSEVIPDYDNGKFVIPPDDPGRKELAAALREMYDRILSGEEPNSPWVNAALWRVIAILSERYFVPGEKKTVSDQRDQLARDAIGYIDLHFREEISLSDVATSVGLQENYFCRYFKRFTGMSFVQYLARIRLRYALSYLTDNGLSVTESAALAGFPSEKAFTGWCKRLKGITPSEYRKSLFSENGKTLSDMKESDRAMENMPE